MYLINGKSYLNKFLTVLRVFHNPLLYSMVKLAWNKLTFSNINRCTVQTEMIPYGIEISTLKVRESGPDGALVAHPLYMPMKGHFRREVYEVDYSLDKNGYSYR